MSCIERNMWSILLSILAIESVQSVAIGYPYRSRWTYNPAQEQYPLKSGALHGYLRYLDTSGAEGLVGYNNLQPVYAVRQIKYVKSAAPVLKTFVINKSDEFTKNREAYLRAASLQQYQNLKSDIDALRNEGKEPSVDRLLKLQTLKKIAFASDFSLTAELPEVKGTLQEIEANISGLYSESVPQSSNQQSNVDESQGEIKTYIGNSNIPLVATEETPEQKQAREEHLRIYNEQIAHLKHLELEHKEYVQKASLKSNIPQSQNVDKTENDKALAELERVQEEHFRLWNEAKLRAEQAGYESGKKVIFETVEKQQISPLTNEQNIYNPRQSNSNIQSPEILSAQVLVHHNNSPKVSISNLAPTQRVADSPANLKNEQDSQEFAGKATNTQNLKTSISPSDLIYVPQQVVDTPEVVRARQEHLRIVNDAILRAKAVKQQEQRSQNPKIFPESINQEIRIGQSQSLEGLPLVTNNKAELPLVVETPEVIKAREEHLRLVHEANLRAQFVEQQELKYKHQSQTPILKTQYEHQQLVYHAEPTQIVQETPEVVKAREEHLRLVNEAKINANLGEQNDKRILLPNQGQQQSAETLVIEETPEVQRAREEHLRIFNAIKSQAEQPQAKEGSRIFLHPESQQKPLLEYSNEEERLLELERLREAERLQKEHQLLDLDRIREAERLAVEKRQMEAELIRLRLEEEQRLEMERLLEVKRLQQEQDELQQLKNGENQEVIIQSDSAGQQPQIAIKASTQPINTNIEQARSQQSSEVAGQHNQQYEHNPFLKVSHISNEPANRLEHSFSQHSPHLKTSAVQDPTNSVTLNSAEKSSDNTLPVVRYVQSSHYSSGNKHQYIKDDNIKHKYHHNTASTQPADTAVALIALEKATNDHFRAHELALEQLRLARLQNPSVKDCN